MFGKRVWKLQEYTCAFVNEQMVQQFGLRMMFYEFGKRGERSIIEAESVLFSARP